MFLMKIQNIIKAREEQLNKQKNYDQKIELIKTKCPLIIINYLLHERTLNRNQQKEYDDSSFTDYIPLMYKNLNNINENQDKLDKIFSSTDICNELLKYLNTTSKHI